MIGDAGLIFFFIKMFEEAERFSKTFYNKSRYRILKILFSHEIW